MLFRRKMLQLGATASQQSAYMTMPLGHRPEPPPLSTKCTACSRQPRYAAVKARFPQDWLHMNSKFLSQDGI